MKKALVLLCGLLLVSVVYGAGSQISFGMPTGVMTDDHLSFNPFMWTEGIEVDIQLGNYLMLSPELTLVMVKFDFKDFFLYPAVILNFTPGPFFIGGGVTKGFYLGSGPSATTDVLLKLNTGLMSKNIKLTVYLISDFNTLFKDMAVGASLGFRF